MVEFPGIDLNQTSKPATNVQGQTIEQYRKAVTAKKLEGDELEIVKEAEEHLSMIQEISVSIIDIVEESKSKLNDILKDCLESL